YSGGADSDGAGTGSRRTAGGRADAGAPVPGRSGRAAAVASAPATPLIATFRPKSVLSTRLRIASLPLTLKPFISPSRGNRRVRIPSSRESTLALVSSIHATLLSRLTASRIAGQLCRSESTAAAAGAGAAWAGPAGAGAAGAVADTGGRAGSGADRGPSGARRGCSGAGRGGSGAGRGG